MARERKTRAGVMEQVRRSASVLGISTTEMVARLQRWYLECGDTMEGTTDKPLSLEDLKRLWNKIFVEGE